MKEQQIQTAILNYLLIDQRVAWAHRMNTGATVINQKGPGRRFIRFGFPGLSDIIGQLKDGRLLAIEVKAPNGKTTDLQKDFINLVNDSMGVAGIARSIDDVITILDNSESIICTDNCRGCETGDPTIQKCRGYDK